jgi:hypothetical protein
MAIGENYYGMQIMTTGSSSTAFFYVNLMSDGAFGGSAISMAPTATQATYFSYNPASVQFNAPAALSVSGGMNVITSANQVAGTLGVSPAIASDTILTLFGSSGTIGSVTLRAGLTAMPFDFRVTASEGFPDEDAASFVTKHAPRPNA